jgi:hypothetical protein
MDYSFRPVLLSSPPPGRPGRTGALDLSEGCMMRAEGGLTEKSAADSEAADVHVL